MKILLPFFTLHLMHFSAQVVHQKSNANADSNEEWFASTWPHRPSSLSEDFWRQLVEQCWERKPVFFEPQPQFELFDDRSVLDAVRSCLAKNKDVCFIIDRKVQQSVPDSFWPSTAETIEAYVSRLDTVLSPAEWSLSVSKLHRASARIWSIARDLLAGLYAQLRALPRGSTDVDLFLGRYATTAVGPHTDHAANLMFTLAGTKTMVLWDPCFTAHLSSTNPAGATSLKRQDACSFSGTRGSLLYMPSEWYHVGETPSRPSASLNVVLFFDRSVTDRLTSIFNKVLQAQLPTLTAASLFSLNRHDPNSFSMVAEQLISDSFNKAVADEIHVDMARRMTSYGFDELFPVVPLREERFGGKERVQVDAPVYFRIADDDKMFVVCNGRSAVLPANRVLVSVLECLNELKPIDREALRESCRSTNDDNIIEALLITLWKLGALRTV